MIDSEFAQAELTGEVLFYSRPEPLSKEAAAILKPEADVGGSKEVSEELLRIRSLKAALPPAPVSGKKRFSSLRDVIDTSRSIAIDREVHACDEACLVRGEEKGNRRDLLRAAEPLERDPRSICGLQLGDHVRARRHLLEDRRVDRARTDGIDPDTTIRQLGRPGADERADGRLGGTVDAQTGEALPIGDRGDKNDGRAITQKRKGLADREG